MQTLSAIGGAAAAAGGGSDPAKDIQLVEQLLQSLRERAENSASGSAGNDSVYKGPAFNIKTFNRRYDQIVWI